LLDLGQNTPRKRMALPPAPPPLSPEHPFSVSLRDQLILCCSPSCTVFFVPFFFHGKVLFLSLSLVHIHLHLSQNGLIVRDWFQCLLTHIVPELLPLASRWRLTVLLPFAVALPRDTPPYPPSATRPPKQSGGGEEHSPRSFIPGQFDPFEVPLPRTFQRRPQQFFFLFSGPSLG